MLFGIGLRPRHSCLITQSRTQRERSRSIIHFDTAIELARRFALGHDRNQLLAAARRCPIGSCHSGTAPDCAPLPPPSRLRFAQACQRLRAMMRSDCVRGWVIRHKWLHAPQGDYTPERLRPHPSPKINERGTRLSERSAAWRNHPARQGIHHHGLRLRCHPEQPSNAGAGRKSG